MKREATGPVAIIFDNFGPYHRARIDGAARAIPVCGIELSAASTDYAWNAMDHDATWKHYTLFPEGTCRNAPLGEVAKRIRELLDKIAPIAVAVPGWAQTSSQLATRWCLDRGVPAIVMSESCAHDEVRRPLQETVKNKLIALHSAALVGGSAHVEYMQTLGMPADRIFTGYDSIDNTYFADGAAWAREQATAMRVRHNLPGKYFLASARFIEKKNLLTLIDAYGAYRADSKDPWSLVLLGDGVLAPDIRARVADLGLADSVALPGFQQYPALPAFYGLAGAFIHASTTEQWGLVVNEAMASGLPVLVSERCGCAPDLVRQGENGFTFAPRDSKQLTGLMTQIASDSCDRGAMGEASRRIVAGFGPDSFGEGLRKAVVTALAAPRPSAGVFTKVLLQGLLYSQSGRTSAAKGVR